MSLLDARQHRSRRKRRDFKVCVDIHMEMFGVMQVKVRVDGVGVAEKRRILRRVEFNGMQRCWKLDEVRRCMEPQVLRADVPRLASPLLVWALALAESDVCSENRQQFIRWESRCRAYLRSRGPGVECGAQRDLKVYESRRHRE